MNIYSLYYAIQKFFISIKRNGLTHSVNTSVKVIASAISKINLKSSQSPKNVPVVSILIPVLNGKDYVRDCLISLVQSIQQISYEVVIVDQKSTDGTLEELRRFADNNPNVVLVENPCNMGFAKAINQAAEIARGKYLVIANSDLIFSINWLSPLIKCVEENFSIAVVSPVTNYVGEGEQLDCDARDIKPEHVNLYASRIASRTTVKIVPDRLVFFCVLIPSHIFKLLGGLAETYNYGNYEDDDFCLRSRLLGYNLAICQNSFVFHYGSKTFKSQKINYKKVIQNNEKIFYSRMYEFTTNFIRLDKVQNRQKIVSVIVRTKDRINLLRQALISLLNQTYQDFEVVIVNDGEEKIELDEVFLKDLDLKVVQGTKKGRSAALNTGLLASSGEYICYLDDDDIFYPFHLELLVKTIRENDTMVLLYSDTNKSLIWEDKSTIIPIERRRFIQKDFNYDELLIENWIPIISVIHSKKVIEKVGLFDENFLMFEDWDYFLRLSLQGQVKRLPRITNEYRFRISEDIYNTTLLQREIAYGCRKLIYEKFPTDSKEINVKREFVIKENNFQIQWLKKVIEEKSLDVFEIARILAGFKY